MSLIIAYLAVILIWSTTPLSIIWSSESVTPSMALLLRMFIALVIGLIWLTLAKIKFPWHTRAIKLYCYSSIGIGGGMFFTYLGAQQVPSGLISLLYGMTPIIAGVLGQKLLAEQRFSTMKKMALALGIIGLTIVSIDKISIAETNLLGIATIVLAVFLFSLSSVLVKTIDINIHPLANTLGTLIVSMPFFIIAWLLTDGSISVEHWQLKSIISIIYLGIFGSLIGFIAYFYILKRLSASTVGLGTLISPVIALCLGYFFNHESITNNLILGASIILFSLMMFLFGQRMSNKI